MRKVYRWVVEDRNFEHLIGWWLALMGVIIAGAFLRLIWIIIEEILGK
jgi:hypothetical protein